jgi:alpha-1,6-mannosyltransferase
VAQTRPEALPIARVGRPSAIALALLGLLALASTWATGLGVTDSLWAPAFLRGYALAWLCYAAAGIVVTRARARPRWLLVWIVLVAVGLRLIALEHTHRISADAYRYLWDGRVANAGLNPFRYPPDAPELKSLRDESWRHINFKHIPTIYPPAAERLFAVLARVRDTDIEAFRWTFALFDLACVVLLIPLLRRTGRPPESVLWYAWCPLAVAESTAGAHVDSFGLFFLLLAFLLTARADGRPGLLSGIALAASVMSKGFALLAVPLFLRRGGWKAAAGFFVTSGLLLLPYLGAGRQLFAGLGAYMRAWETNASIFIVINEQLQRVVVDNFLVTRVITLGAVTAVVAVLTWRLRPGLEPLLAATFTAFGAQLFIGAPTLPWYVLWLLPALCWWAIPGLVLFTLTVSLQYYARWIYPGNRPMQYALLWAGYVPVYLLLISQLVVSRATSRRPIPEPRSGLPTS